MKTACQIIPLIFLIVLNAATGSVAQKSTIEFPEELHKKRLTGVVVTGSVLYAGTMAGLYSLWYTEYPRSSFHFIDDNRDWMLLDKIGHVFTAYNVGRLGHLAFRWCGVREKPAIWAGGSLGFIFLTTVEIFDGFSARWGASWGDILANGIGTGLFIGQQFGWKEQRVFVKYSFHTTEYARYRPDLLGESTLQQLLKDYNGQTYWLSANVHSFLKKESKFPKWLNIAFGYGAKGMLGAEKNPESFEGQQLPIYNRTGQYYFSLDIDLTRIRTKSQFVNAVFQVLGSIKIPAPAIEYNAEDKFKFHFLYF